MPRLLAALLVPIALAAPRESAGQQHELDALAAAALARPAGPARYIENLKFGTRSVTFHNVGISPSDSNTLYVVTFDGFVYGTSDGGLSWTEARLITQRLKFFGAIRPSENARGTPLDTSSVFGLTTQMPGSFLNWNLTSKLELRDSGQCFLEDCTDGNVDALDDTGQYGRLMGDGLRFRLPSSPSGGGGGGDASRFGVGITRAAPRLQALLKKRKARLLGLNLKLLLNLRGVEPTWGNHVAVHPTDPKTALAATAMGLFKTVDGGISWIDTYNGRNNVERWAHIVVYDPLDPNRVFLGTGLGLLLSYDGGESFRPISGTQLSSARTRWIEFAPSNPKVVYAGTTIGVFRSDDGGDNWRWIFYETLPQANVISAIAIDAKNPDRVQISTADGLFRTRDGGKNWERSGAFLFTSQWVARLVADPNDPKHLVCATYRHVWETFDWGETWGAMYINDSDWSPRAMYFDPHEKGTFWILTSSEMLRIRNRPPKQPDPTRLAALEAQIRAEPTLSGAMDAAFRAHDVHMGVRGRLRNRTWGLGLMPQLNAVAGIFSVSQDVNLFFVPFDSAVRHVTDGTKYGPDALESGATFSTGFKTPQPYFGLMLNWDFSNLIFHLEEAPYGRYFGDANGLYLRVKYEVQRLYEERRRVLIRLMTQAPSDVRSWLALRMRLEELTAHLNILTGGLYKASVQWVESIPWLPEGMLIETTAPPRVPGERLDATPTIRAPKPRTKRRTRKRKPRKKTKKTRTLNF